MKKYIIYLLYLPLMTLQAEEWELRNTNLYIENDADVRTDEAYSHGAKLSFLYLRKNSQNSSLHIPFTEYKSSQNYISFAYTQELFTPNDIESKELVVDDRPYAGYMGLQAGLHQSLEDHLKTLIVQIGIVGPSAQMEAVQEFVHGIIGSPMPQGWDNQLHDEPVFQVNYGEKIYYDLGKIFSLDSVIIPEYGFELGNASTKLYAGALYRFGGDIPKDYGSYAIDNHSYSKIPLNAKVIDKEWHYCFNFGLKTNAIARNIYLDGNRDGESHSVEKENFTLDVTYGFSLNYNNMSLDYTRTQTTKEFKGQKNYLGYGSLLFSYNF
jgi:hypothetical protein